MKLEMFSTRINKDVKERIKNYAKQNKTSVQRVTEVGLSYVMDHGIKTKSQIVIEEKINRIEKSINKFKQEMNEIMLELIFGEDEFDFGNNLNNEEKMERLKDLIGIIQSFEDDFVTLSDVYFSIHGKNVE